MTADEILEQMANNPELYAADPEEICTIDNDLRTIAIPSGLQTVGVESDEDVRRLNFQMPKQYHEVDLSEFNIRINFMNANNQGDAYAVTDKQVSGDNITFSWMVGRNALAYRGNIRFIVCLKKTDAEGVVQQEFNTTIAQLTVLEGLETTEAVVAENPDIIEQILQRLDELKAGGGGGGTPGKDGREIEIQNNGTAIQWRYVGDDEWTDLVQLSEITGPKGDPGEGIPEGGTTGQVLTKNSDSDGDASWKNPSTVSDEQVKTAVDNYLTENPVQGGITSNASSLLITILRSGVFNSDQSSNITELEKELQGNGSEEGGGEEGGDIDDNVKYGLHNAAGYTGKLETGLKTTITSPLNIDKIVLDIDIKTDTMPTTKYILLRYYFTQVLAINASGKWVFNGSETNVIADKTPDDVMGNGRTTITFSNLTGITESNLQQWELMGGNAQETPEVIWYNVKFYSGDTLKADLTPTSKLGDMYDSVSEKTRSFSEIDGLELVEVK